MNKYAILFLLSLPWSSVQILYGQWQPDLRLTYDDSVSTNFFNYAWCTAAQGDTVYVVWDDNREGSYEIYFKRTVDNGTSWTPDILLSSTGFDSHYGHIAVDGCTVHVIWQDEKDGNCEIYYKSSSCGGDNWTGDVRLTNDESRSSAPSIAVNDSVVHIVWVDERANGPELFYKRSINAGSSWEPDRQLTDDPLATCFPSISVSDTMVHITFAIAWDIYYLRSTDDGVTWGEIKRLTNDGDVSWFPSIASTDTMVHIVWHDQRDGNTDIFYKRSCSGGTIWEDDTNLTANIYNSNIPSLAVSDSMIHVVWYDYRDGNYEIYYKGSYDTGISWEQDIRLTDCGGTSKSPCICASTSYIHVIWVDDRDGNYEIYYKNDPTGNFNIEPKNKIETRCAISVEIFPNPFQEKTRIVYSVEHDAQDLQIGIYDITGKCIKSYYCFAQNALCGTLFWDGTDETGFSVPNGVYLVVLCDRESTEKTTVIRLRKH